MSLDFTPHDQSFRKVFDDPHLARQLFTHYLPTSVVERLDLSTLQADSETFVDDKLKDRLGDLLFRTRLKDGGEAFIYVLLEHKSSPDRWVVLQLLKYMVRIWNREIDRKNVGKMLPPILPVVFYHGKQNWDIPVNLSDLVAFPEGFGRYAPDFQYELLNCQAIPDERLESVQPAGGVVMIYKHAFDEDFAQHLDRWLAMIEDLVRAQTVGEQVLGMLNYLAYLCHNVSGRDFEQKVIEAFPEEGQRIMSSVLEQWIERGKKIGREEAFEEGKQKGREEGKQEGREGGLYEGKRDAVLEVIQERFDQIPPGVNDLISGATDGATLDAMLRVAVRAQTVEQLTRRLREARADS